MFFSEVLTGMLFYMNSEQLTLWSIAVWPFGQCAVSLILLVQLFCLNSPACFKNKFKLEPNQRASLCTKFAWATTAHVRGFPRNVVRRGGKLCPPPHTPPKKEKQALYFLPFVSCMHRSPPHHLTSASRQLWCWWESSWWWWMHVDPKGERKYHNIWFASFLTTCQITITFFLLFIFIFFTLFVTH